MPRMTLIHPLSTEVTEELREKFCRMLARLDDMRAQSGTVDTPGVWRPAIDLGEQEDAVLIRIELPGVRPDQIRLTLRNQLLRVEGRKERPGPSESTERPVRFLCLERSYGTFAFNLSLHWQIDRSRITARLSDGILDIRLPKSDLATPEMVIPIES
jgi:HSP20 family protein